MDISYQISKLKCIVVTGATGEIGFSFIKKVLQQNTTCKVFALCRMDSKSDKISILESYNQINVIKMNLLDESEWERLIIKIKEYELKIDLVLNTVGFLHNEKISPEKSLRSISVDNLVESFKVNTIVTSLSAKYLTPLISKNEKTAFVQLSAKVGSISDNSIGGWYGYRASKAALNMFIKTYAIEVSRKNIQCSVMCIHPGTTKSNLSSPFLKGIKHKVWEADDTAENIINVIEKGWDNRDCKFYNWDQSQIQW